MILSRPFYNPSTSYLMGLLTLKGQDYIRFYFVRTENNIQHILQKVNILILLSYLRIIFDTFSVYAMF